MAFQQQRGIARQSAWPDLPPELLERIVAVLAPRDRVAVRLVCASWRACVRECFPTDLPFEAPRLLLRRPGTGGGLAFFSLQHRKILPFTLPASLGAGRCCGHIGGWLAMASDADRSILLCNPVSGRSVALPPPPVFPVSKMVLSGPPTSGCWVAAALGRTGTIVLFQPAVSSAWMTIGVNEGAKHGGFRDMAFWSGRLCALGHDGAVLAFRGDLRARAAAVSLLREAEHALGTLAAGHWRLYLVEGDGELLVVRKLYMVRRNSEAVDLAVEVHVLSSAAERKWELVEEMPGRAVFVGSVVSAAVPLELYPAAGLRESCVYFARREVEMLAPHAICEYSMMDEEMRTVPIAGGHSADVEPVWITPFKEPRPSRLTAEPSKDSGYGDGDGGDWCDAEGGRSEAKKIGRGRRGPRRPNPAQQRTTTTRQCQRRRTEFVRRDEGHAQGPLRGRQGHGRHHPRRPRRRPPRQGLRHRGRLRQRAFPAGPHPHPREARRLPRRPQAPQPGCALPVHELGARARQARQPHLHPLHQLRHGPRGPRRRAALPHRARLQRHLRPRQQGHPLPLARLRRLPPQVHLRARGRPPHHRRAPLRHQQERLGVRRHQEVRRRGHRQGHLRRLHQAARPRVDQGQYRRRLLQGWDDIRFV